MSSKDGQSSSFPAAIAPLTVAPTTNALLGARVHHSDESSERTQYALVNTSLAGRFDIDTITSRLSRSDTVVFTDYVRVQ